MRKRKYISKKERWVSNGYGGKVKKTYYKYPRRYRPRSGGKSGPEAQAWQSESDAVNSLSEVLFLVQKATPSMRAK